MKPIEEFPEVPEGLEREVYDLYESTVKVHDDFPSYFKERAETFKLSEKDAKVLDYLVHWLHGTYETIKKISANGKYNHKSEVRFNVFIAAGSGQYNDTGLVTGLDRSTGNFGDYATISSFGQGLNEKIAGVLISFDSETRENLQENLKEDALSALKDKLRFEAAMYEGMKKVYDVTVALPS